MVDSSSKTVEEMSKGLREMIYWISEYCKIGSSCVLRKNADVDDLLRIRIISLLYTSRIHLEY